MNDEDTVLDIVQAIADKKGVNFLALDVRGVSSSSDYVVVAGGNVDRHVVAIAQEVTDLMNQKGTRLTGSEGVENGNWVVLEFSSIIVHIFTPFYRERYRIESLWPEAKLLNLESIVSSD
jgi:ribosome-associated protein